MWAYNPYGLMFAVPQANYPRFRHLRSGREPLAFLAQPFSSVVRPAFSADGRMLAALDTDGRSVHLFDMELTQVTQ